jgi:hypothetical protein
LDEVTGGWKGCFEEFHNLYSSSDIIRMVKSRRDGQGTQHAVEMRNAYKILVGKSEGKRPLERPRYRWEDNIEMDLKKVRE